MLSCQYDSFGCQVAIIIAGYVICAFEGLGAEKEEAISSRVIVISGLWLMLMSLLILEELV